MYIFCIMNFIKRFFSNFLDNDNINEYNKYKYKAVDECFLTYIYRKYWTIVQNYIPSIIHPNILTMCGLFSIIPAYYYGNNTYGNYLMAIGTFLYLTFDGIDGIHARQTKQTSIIGEYIDHIVDIINLGIIGDALCNQIGLSNNYLIKNMLLSTASYGFIIPHYESLELGYVIFEKFTDVSLLLTLCIIIFLSNAEFPEILLNSIILPILYLNYFFIQKLLSLKCTSVKSAKIKFIIIIYYIIKLLTSFNNAILWQITLIDSVLLLQIINYKIFKIEPDYKIILIPILHLYIPTFTIICVLIYILFVIYKISNELNINLLYNNIIYNMKQKVYCCGVFDICHLGHMILFENIVKSFDKPIELIVGVHSDEECKSYKREPILNEDIRCETVEHCKYVDKVIKNAGLVVTKEFILENNIDCVIIGEEYKGTKDYTWYGDAMDMKIEKYIPRYEKLSTSDIINKIKKY